MSALAPTRSRSRHRPRSRVGAPGRRCGAGKAQIPRRGGAVSGRRYYSPSQGRFLGRDPSGEIGGLHLYSFVRNGPINRWDVLGMYDDDGFDDDLVIAADGGSSKKPKVPTPSAVRNPDGSYTFTDVVKVGDKVVGTNTYTQGGSSDFFFFGSIPISGSSGGTSVVGVGDGGGSTTTSANQPQPSVFYSDDGTPHIIWSGGTGVAVQVAFTATAKGGASHSIVIFTDMKTGQQLMAEAAPSGQSQSGGLNRLVPNDATLVAQPFRSFDASQVPIIAQQDVGVLNLPIADVSTAVRTYNNAVNLSSIPYSGSTLGGYNSNSYGAGLIINFGFDQPPLPQGLNGLGPVGWNNPLPPPNP